jgi:RHS repeat-associated protein
MDIKLPPNFGNYRFRVDYDDVQFWSPSTPSGSGQAQENGCTLPGCTSTTVTLPGGTSEVTTTIDYTYDPLYRLTNADYSTGDSYQYAYDSVGNRLTQESFVHGLSSTVTYNYDIANRLADVNGVAYTYDDNGNLLNDGVNTYAYDSTNRLTSVLGPSSATYTYNGLGDRLSQNGVNYTLDLNTGLTQVLSDGTTSYTYGLGRISQQGGSTPEYFLGDALGSVRQLANNAGEVTLAKSYDPYGVVTQSSGVGQSAYGFTGESQDVASGLVYLRSRYYNVNDGRFQSRDTWDGNANHPMSLNRWSYTQSNPVNLVDPTGNFPIQCHAMPTREEFENCVRKIYHVAKPRYYTLEPYFSNPLSNSDTPGCHYYVSKETPIPYDGKGYLEGYGVTTAIAFSNHEIVYDFSTMTRGSFLSEGYYFSDTPVGVFSNVYAGLIGLNYRSGFSSQRGLQDYGGPSYFDSIGGSTPTKNFLLPSVGANRTHFATFNAEPLMGYTIGIAIGEGMGVDGIPVLDLGAGWSKATLQSIKSYTYESPNGQLFVNDGQLAADILHGVDSPWAKNPLPITQSDLLPMRVIGASLALNWAKTFNDLNNGDVGEPRRNRD